MAGVTPGAGRRFRMRRPSGRAVLLALLLTYLALPIAATILYSLATVWRDTIIPEGFTLSHWSTTLADGRAMSAIGRSVVLALLSVGIVTLVVVPAVYWARIRNPRLRRPLEAAALIPFALPMVVIGIGMLRLTTDAAPELQGTLLVLVIAHAAAAFPFVYWAVDAAMAAARIELLSEAAQTCGASTFQTLRRVVFPNVRAGIATGGVLALAFSLGEFALAQVLVGASYETVPLWSAEVFNKTTSDFNSLSVMTSLMLVILFAVSAVFVAVSHGRGLALFPTQSRHGGDG